LTGRDQTGSIEAYQSGGCRFAVLSRVGTRSSPDSGRKLMTRQGELSVSRPLVIVVDDDVAVRNSLKFSLEVEGFAVRAYSGGIELLKDSELLRGGCLVIDQNMPGMQGLDLVAQLRARDVAMPAILITSSPTAALSERAAKAGVAIVEKPLLGTALLDRIRDQFSRDSAERAV
jgi:two-component system, LuxR family, response regulator FixJ